MILTGAIAHLPDDSPSAMQKRPVTDAVRLGRSGFAGDEQADRRFHGGPDQALHYYPTEHYAALAAHFLALTRFGPGDLGENLSEHGWLETDVRLGDVFTLGPCSIEASQPRVPCHKIAKRLDEPEAPAFVAASARVGWYFRVIESGIITPGDSLRLIERSEATPKDRTTLAHPPRTRRRPRPDPRLGQPPRTRQSLACQVH